ncbi:MAG: alcohol dehydrogenase family protein [Paracoccaceae bacterium]|nr:alcohol dehydrogenase family protein [Paracoccaceae bacterium]
MTLPERMRAMVLTGHGGLDRLEFRDDWPVPKPARHEVLIQVLACGLNNTDINTRTGWYSKAVTTATTGTMAPDTGADAPDPTWGGGGLDFPRIQGADVVGRVVECGAEANPNLLGQRVMTDNWLRDWNDPMNRDQTGYFGSEKDGGYAEFTVIDHRNVGIIRSSLTDAELATFSCSYSTAEGMLERADVGDGDQVLVTGASGGVGSALVQLAKRRGAGVVALASEANHRRLRQIGADAVLPRAPEDLAASLVLATGSETVSVVADIVGGDRWGQLLDVLCRGGRYACSGAIAGPIVTLDLRTLYLNDLTLHGSTIIPPHVFGNLLGYVERQEIRPLLAATYPLEALHDAQTAFIAKRHFGNIVVVP